MQTDTFSDRRDDDGDNDLTKGERDVTPRLVHLGDMSELQVADGNPDIRGWDVRTAAGEKIGTVTDLVVDTQLMKVRYIEAQIDQVTNNDDLPSGGARHVLLPIGSARLDDDKDDVYMSAMVADPRLLPSYDRVDLSREYEVSLRDRFSGNAGTNPASRSVQTSAGRDTDEDAFYNGELYDDANFFGTRRRGRESANYIGPTGNEPVRRDNDTL